MCLAIPGEVILVDGDDPLLRMAKVRFGGITKEVSVAYTPEVKPGEYVLVHVGFALSIIDEREAKRVFSYLEDIGEADGATEETLPDPDTTGC